MSLCLHLLLLFFFFRYMSLTPKSDKRLISPYHITPKQNIKKNGNDYQPKKLFIVQQILLVCTVGNV